MAQPTDVTAQLEEMLSQEPPTSLGDMAAALGVTASGGKEGKAPPVPVSPPGVKKEGGTRSTSGVSVSSVKQASDTIASMMRRDPAPIPTEDDVALRKLDEMSVVSDRLEEELAEERAKREDLEKRLDELYMSHNALATQFVQLTSKWEASLKGDGRKGKEGAVSASSLVGSAGSPAGSRNASHLPPPTNKPSSSPAPRGGLARGRRRGGL